MLSIPSQTRAIGGLPWRTTEQSGLQDGTKTNTPFFRLTLRTKLCPNKECVLTQKKEGSFSTRVPEALAVATPVRNADQWGGFYLHREVRGSYHCQSAHETLS